MIGVDFWTLMGRALRLRCPICGKGKLFKHIYTLKMYEKCPVCSFKFEREDGYFTGAMAINIVVSELLITAAIVPFSIAAGLNPAIPFYTILFSCLPLPALLPLLFFKHSRSLWMSTDHWLNPPNYRPPQGDLTIKYDEMLR